MLLKIYYHYEINVRKLIH